MFLMDIEQLVRQGRLGDEKALGSLYGAYHRRMTEICRRIVGDSGVAEELAHDAFLLAFAKMDTLRNPQRFESWLTTITTRMALRYKQRNHEPKTLSLSTLSEEELPAATQQPDEKALPAMSELMVAVDALPNGYGHVFKLSVIQGKSHKEIAEILGIAAHSSSSQLSRAKKMLQKSLAHYAPHALWQGVLSVGCWVLLLAYLMFKTDNKTEPFRPIATQQEEPAKPSIVRSAAPDTPTGTTRRGAVAPAMKLKTDSNMTVDTFPQNDLSDTIREESPLPYMHHNNGTHIADLLPERPTEMKSQHSQWSIDLTFTGGMNEQGDKLTENPIPNITSDIIERKSHHCMPVAWTLALRYNLSNRFGLETGLSYSRLKSEFETSTNGNAIYEEQAIHYVGIPLKGAYHIYIDKPWNIYGSLGAKMEIPVYAPVSTRYILNGKTEATEKGTLHAPLQWSIGTGLGVQYNITPRIALFVEPSLQYYLPTGTSIETYHTEHPFTFSLPVGIRFTPAPRPPKGGGLERMEEQSSSPLGGIRRGHPLLGR